MDFYYDIDFIFPNDEPPFESSSDDDELELTLAIAIEELNNEGASTSRRRSIQPRKFICVILCKVITSFSMIILLKQQCILLMYFEEGFE